MKTEEDLIKDIRDEKLPYGRRVLLDILTHAGIYATRTTPISVQDLAQKFVEQYILFNGYLGDLVFTHNNIRSWKDLSECYRFLISKEYVSSDSTDNLEKITELDKTIPFVAHITELAKKTIYDGTSTSNS